MANKSEYEKECEKRAICMGQPFKAIDANDVERALMITIERTGKQICFFMRDEQQRLKLLFCMDARDLKQSVDLLTSEVPRRE